jgi:hypothetical protein
MKYIALRAAMPLGSTCQVPRSPLLGMWEFPAAAASNQFRQFGISWPPPVTEKVRGLLLPIGQIPVCQFVRQHPQR